jgi:hypothetical protein
VRELKGEEEERNKEERRGKANSANPRSSTKYIFTFAILVPATASPTGLSRIWGWLSY